MNEAELEVSSDSASYKQRLEVLQQQEELIEDEEEQEAKEAEARRVKKEAEEEAKREEAERKKAEEAEKEVEKEQEQEKLKESEEKQQAKEMLPEEEVRIACLKLLLAPVSLTLLAHDRSRKSTKKQNLKRREKLSIPKTSA